MELEQLLDDVSKDFFVQISKTERQIAEQMNLYLSLLGKQRGLDSSSDATLAASEDALHENIEGRGACLEKIDNHIDHLRQLGQAVRDRVRAQDPSWDVTLPL
jgi:hypothetical protein